MPSATTEYEAPAMGIDHACVSGADRPASAIAPSCVGSCWYAVAWSAGDAGGDGAAGPANTMTSTASAAMTPVILGTSLNLQRKSLNAMGRLRRTPRGDAAICEYDRAMRNVLAGALLVAVFAAAGCGGGPSP